MNERLTEIVAQFNMQIHPAYPDHNQAVLEKLSD